MASQTAKVAKEKGNASFKAGNFAEAVGHYSAAIVADTTDPTYPLNRAAAYLKLGKHRDAERDCSKVLSLDAKNVKALFRRAQARVALDSLAGAEKDLTEALQLEPANASIKQELDAVKKSKQESAKKQLASKREPITISPLPPPNSESQTYPSKRIVRNVPIEIVEDEEPPTVTTAGPSTDFLKPIQSRVLSPSASPPAPVPTAPAPSVQTAPQPKPRVGAAIFRADGKHTIIRDPALPPKSAAAPSPSPSPSPSPVPSPSPAAVVAPSHSPAPTSSPSRLPTLFAFSRSWHALPTAHERYALLRGVPPESLPPFFKTSLEPSLLMSIVHTLEDVASPTTAPEVAAYMTAFPRVSRFTTVVLFLSDEEKAVVRRVWDALGDGYDAPRRAWAV